MLPVAEKEIKICKCGEQAIKNIFGFMYCPRCKIFFCAQCGAPLKPPNNGEAKCTQCNNGAATKSLRSVAKRLSKKLFLALIS